MPHLTLLLLQLFLLRPAAAASPATQAATSGPVLRGEITTADSCAE